MMKRFCNICEAEITKQNEMPFRTLEAPFRGVDADIARVTVVLDVGDCDDDFDACKYCVLDAIDALDDRDVLVEGP